MTRNSNETQIRALVEKWASAVRAKDMDGALANHADDIVMFDVPLPLQSKGMGEYKKTWELFFDNSPGGPGSFDVAELQISAGDTVAFAYGLLHIGGSKEPVGRLTVGFQKVHGKWLIVHEHHSYPVELNSGK